MPRKNPLPKREQEICRRLREYRHKIKFTRVGFAGEAGLDSSNLAACEHARTPLRYGMAWRVISLFRINPQWLATGDYPMSIDAPGIASPEDIGIDGKELFSKVYEKYLAPQVQQAVKSIMAVKRRQFSGKSTYFGLNSGDRFAAESFLVAEVREWIEKVPDAKLNEFWNGIVEAAEQLIVSYPPDPESVIEKRRRELEAIRTSVAARGNFRKG